MSKIVCLGEAMVELSGARGAWNVGYGGDTLNTAIHLARAGHDVAYMTALGTDAFSDGMRSAWAAEGIDCGLVLSHPARQAGLYAITTDAGGERSFTYWRETSAARTLFELEAAKAAMKRAEQADLLCFSLISLAILPAHGRQDLLGLATRVKARGGLVAFDGNYRPRLWESDEEARELRDLALAVSDIGLPTLDDEKLMNRSAPDAAAQGETLKPQQVADHWAERGCGEVVVKLGEAGCLLPDGRIVPVPTRLHPVDTSGAGDAFNGGYLAARMNGAAIADAAAAGHALAGWNVMRKGAIPPVDADAPYRCFAKR